MREQYSGIPLPRLTITQNTTDQDAREAMRRLTALTPTDRGDVLSAFAQLNVDPSRLLAGGNPSPGELRKLLLCLGLRDHPHLIVMDAPPTHLDTPARCCSSLTTRGSWSAQHPSAGRCIRTPSAARN